MRLRSALLAAGLIVACLLAALVGPIAPEAIASGPNRAVVVADSGTGVIVRGIEFEADSISGIEALQLAGLAPVVQGFQGEGGAVCAVAGVGCPSDGSCLTCDARGYYWAYHRAPAGTGGYAYSRVGAGATRVHDGDVEGWKWGTGSAPAYHSFDSVFPPAPVTTAPPAGGTPGGGGPGVTTAPGPGGGSPDAGAAPGTGTDSAGAGEPATTTSVADPATTTSVAAAAGATTTSVAAADTADADEIAFQAAQSSRPDESGSRRGTVASAALFLVTLGGIAALVVRSRRRRAATALD
ncbi:MAG: hypothetical protein JNK12_06450 [Acidimicrobiales bacterium]|nr:hypothetical protein [Acidimicrobiales bacterium]